MNTIRHTAISASAGSGKTYQLTNRFIQLLHYTEMPERIIALTFTRTASGEFFQKIIEKLADAAADPAIANSLSKELKIDADASRYHDLLEILIKRMHQLNLQTLDSFFFRIVSSFALELGLSGSLNLLDESSEPRMRNQVRDQIVHQQGELSEEFNEFWQAFKQATYGKEERSVERIVSDYIERLYHLYLEAPAAGLWGQASRIWPAGCPWKPSSEPDWEALASQIEASAEADLAKQRAFQTLLSDLRNYPAQEKMNTLLKRVFEQARSLFAGPCRLKVGKKEFDLGGELCQALASGLRAIFWHHLQRSLQNTQGVYRILQAYDENYDRIVRRAGKIAFADLTHLLAPTNEASPVARIDPFARELMDFRLDGKFDHWLFDEFQDTSRAQWNVVSNLIDEVLQDNSGERSFFYVGDTKQCLYLWRNSDDRLFHEIKAGYDHIESNPLSTSWRSAPAILDAVNTVFSDPILIAECFSKDAAKRWARAWQSHQAS
ncbi:MAG: UvrD-helicase domain-containing protein, partial [Verrucomicrobiota bacterium]